jgi:hypothetical protein
VRGVLGPGLNDGARDKNNPERANTGPIEDPAIDPTEFLLFVEPEIGWMTSLLQTIKDTNR